MSARRPPAPDAQPPAAAADEPRRPFAPRIEGELRQRLTAYAKARGRSRSGATRWLLHVALKQEGF